MKKNVGQFKILFIVNTAIIGSDPIGVMQLSAIAKKNNCDTRLCLARENYLEVVKSYQPDLIAVSVMSPDYDILKQVVADIKNVTPSVPIVMGGPHPTFQPNCIHEVDADAICVGEGDDVFPGIIDRIQNKQEFSNLANIHTKSKTNALAPLVENLDMLPPVDREILYDHVPAFKRFKFRNFYTSRGCPYNCSYCYNHAYNDLYNGLGKIVRKRTVDGLIDEIKAVSQKYPTDFIKFSDDSFVHQVDGWLEDFARKYKKQINLPFYCLIRPDRVNRDMVRLLKNAGCHSVCMSIETGNETIRKKTLKRNVSNLQLMKAFRLFQNEDIKTLTNSMLAIPGTTLENDIETLDMNIACQPSCCGFSMCVPYYGTDIYQYCIEEGLLSSQVDMLGAAPSLTDYSVVNAYTDEDKRFQKNLSLLGLFLVKFPILKTFFKKYLFKLPTNLIFHVLHFLLGRFMLKKHILPMKFSMTDTFVFGRELIGSAIRDLKHQRRHPAFTLEQNPSSKD